MGAGRYGSPSGANTTGGNPLTPSAQGATASGPGKGGPTTMAQTQQAQMQEAQMKQALRPGSGQSASPMGSTARPMTQLDWEGRPMAYGPPMQQGQPMEMAANRANQEQAMMNAIQQRQPMGYQVQPMQDSLMYQARMREAAAGPTQRAQPMHPYQQRIAEQFRTGGFDSLKPWEQEEARNLGLMPMTGPPAGRGGKGGSVTPGMTAEQATDLRNRELAMNGVSPEQARFDEQMDFMRSRGAEPTGMTRMAAPGSVTYDDLSNMQARPPQFHGRGKGGPIQAAPTEAGLAQMLQLQRMGMR